MSGRDPMSDDDHRLVEASSDGPENDGAGGDHTQTPRTPIALWARLTYSRGLDN